MSDSITIFFLHQLITTQPDMSYYVIYKLPAITQELKISNYLKNTYLLKLLANDTDTYAGLHNYYNECDIFGWRNGTEIVNNIVRDYLCHFCNVLPEVSNIVKEYLGPALIQSFGSRINNILLGTDNE
jgi:hypothetical protein